MYGRKGWSEGVVLREGAGHSLRIIIPFVEILSANFRDSGYEKDKISS